MAVRIRQGGEPAGISLSPRRRRRSCAAVVRADVSFVGADEAKRLVDEEGYTVLDIRDRTQRERAHIKSSTHVPTKSTSSAATSTTPPVVPPKLHHRLTPLELANHRK